MSSPQRTSSVESTADSNIRKRVCKACDRCRLKKSKCDGANPCSRCKADNAICVFGERKKSHDKVYPKGYVEMLEQQQAQLVAGLRELYRRLQAGEGWPGPPLQETQAGHPLTHDILERLDLLHVRSDGTSNYEGFEEDCSRMQQRLVRSGAAFIKRRDSISSASDHGRTSSASSLGTPPAHVPQSNDPFARNGAPPTPPMQSPFSRQSQICSTVKPQFALPTLIHTTGLNPEHLMRSTWPTQIPTMADEMDIYSPYETYDAPMSLFNGMAMQAPTSNSPLAMNDWTEHEVDFSSFIQASS